MVAIIQRFDPRSVLSVVIAQISQGSLALSQDPLVRRKSPQRRHHHLSGYGPEFSLVLVAVVGDILDAPARLQLDGGVGGKGLHRSDNFLTGSKTAQPSFVLEIG